MPTTSAHQLRHAPQQPLPPVSTAHQEGLRLLIEQFQAQGQDVGLLALLADSLPALRAGLNQHERGRIESLDHNHQAFLSAHERLHAAISACATLLDDTTRPTMLLLSAALLEETASIAVGLAEAANDLALRAQERITLLG